MPGQRFRPPGLGQSAGLGHPHVDGEVNEADLHLPIARVQ
jgi:hypothetical protein